MLNLGLEQNKAEDALGSLEKGNESDKELGKEKKAEGEKPSGLIITTGFYKDPTSGDSPEEALLGGSTLGLLG